MTIFANELHDMTSTARELIADVFDIPREAQVEELPYGYGATYRTDIAGVKIDPDAVATRRERFHGLVPLNTEWRYLKSYLWLRRRAPVSKAVWMDDGPYVDSSKEQIWRWLGQQNFLQFDVFGEPATVPDVPIHGDQYAFELKPKDWEKALRQASRSFHGTYPEFYEERKADADLDRMIDDRPWLHGGYADFAVVIMDADHVDPALEHADQFDDLGVGLASMDRSELVVHIDPERQDPYRWSRNRIDLNERAIGACHLAEIDNDLDDLVDDFMEGIE